MKNPSYCILDLRCLLMPSLLFGHFATSNTRREILVCSERVDPFGYLVTYV